MSGLPAPSALVNVWPRMSGPPTTGPLTSGPTSFGGGNPTGLPMINNPNLPSSAIPNTGNLPPPIPQTPSTPFPALRQPFGGTNSINSTNYGLPQNFPPYNSVPTNLVCDVFPYISLLKLNNRYQIQRKSFKMKLINDD